VVKGKLCSQHAGFNLHAQTKVAANDKKGRETLAKYILRPSLANDRLKILDDGNVRLEFIVMGTLEGFRWNAASKARRLPTRVLGPMAPRRSTLRPWPSLPG
jgi:hypothetical protein